MRKCPLFHKTAFRKNVTRFAPVWILYTLCLLMGMVLLFTGNSYRGDRCYIMASNVMRLPDIMGSVNLIYAVVIAQLLFGDLYNSRMAGALHALPLRRETWLITNVVSGIAFSFVPTLIAALALFPLLAGSVFVGAWKLPLLFLLSANLEFLCFFGIAVFSSMCVGNRFTMLAGYGLLNAGAAIAYWVINTLYTPLLYGVITPSAWADDLTPIMHITARDFFTIETDYSALWNLAQQRRCQISDLSATFALTDNWWRLFALAGVGLALMAAALFLYRKRNLECAGDAVAFPILRPIFQVLCTLFVASASQYLLRSELGYPVDPSRDVLRYIVLALGLAVGWFVGKMLLARSLQVFGKKSWQGLGILTALMALSLVCTHFDILGIETRLPNPEDVDAAYLGSYYPSSGAPLRGADAEKVIRIQSRALESRLEYDGLYIRGYDGSFVEMADTNSSLYDQTNPNPEYTYVTQVSIRYVMKNGSTMERHYNIWTDSEEGNLARQLLSRWEYVSGATAHLPDGTEVNVAEYVTDNILYWTLEGERVDVRQENARAFLEAIKADCSAGNMAPRLYHRGLFQKTAPTTDWNGETYYEETPSLSLYLGTGNLSWIVSVYPDSTNSIRWLREHGLLEDWEIDPDACYDWHPVEASEVLSLTPTMAAEPAEPTQPSATKPAEP